MNFSVLIIYMYVCENTYVRDIIAINNSGKVNYRANISMWLLSFTSHFTFLSHATKNSNYQTTSLRLLITTLYLSILSKQGDVM